MKVISKKQELRDVTITHVSYVKRGANRKIFLMSKSEEKNPDVEFDVRVIKDNDSSQKLLYGVVYEPDSVDAHDDLMSAEEIEKTAHEFTIRYRNIDNEHNLIAGAGEVVESYIAPCNLEINNSEVKKGSWILVTKATDEIWQGYVDGDITGYSMFGIARKTIAKNEESIPWIQKFLERLGVVKTFQETLEAEINAIKKDPGFLMYIAEENWYREIDWEMEADEKLLKLSESMLEASSYIKELVNNNVSKSEEQNEVVDGVKTSHPENVPGEETSDEVIEDEKNEDVENTEETEKPEEIDDVDDAEKTEEEVEEVKLELNPEIEKLKEQLSDLQKKYDKLAVQSNVASPINQKPEPKIVKPRIL
jgi:hypothetical protein